MYSVVEVIMMYEANLISFDEAREMLAIGEVKSPKFCRCNL
jgi:hypothetical protein